MQGPGGRRPGPGRTPNAEKYAVPLAAAYDRLAAALPDVAEALIDISLGLRPREKWVPAGTVTRKDALRKKERPKAPGDDEDDDPDGLWVDAKGKPVLIDVPVFPDLPPGKLVKVEQITNAPDIRAIAEFWARLAGRPNLESPPDPALLDLGKALAAAQLILAGRQAAQAPPPAPDGGDDVV